MGRRASAGAAAAKRSPSPKKSASPKAAASSKRGAPAAANRSSSPGRSSVRGSEEAPASNTTASSLPEQADAKKAAAPSSAASATAATCPEDGIIPSNVFVCIGPSDSSVATLMGAKALQNWTDQTVTLKGTYAFFSSDTEYGFPRRVFGPEVEQREMFDVMLPRIIEALTRGDGGAVGYDSMFLLYGHAGTRKAEIMFGRESGCGVLPQICDAVFRAREARKEETSFVLTASVVELRWDDCFDLLDGRTECVIDNEGTPLASKLVLNSMEDLKRLLSSLEGKYPCSTMSDECPEDDDDCSRSHVAFIFTLLQMDFESGDYTKTTFSLLDLAYAERPHKTDQEHLDFLNAVMELRMFNGLSKDEKPGAVINYELQKIKMSPVRASKEYASGALEKFHPDGSNAVIRFLSGCFTGKAMLNMAVILSEAGQNGWDTWFSLQCGADFGKLQIPVCHVKVQHFAKVLKRTLAALKKSKLALAKRPGRLCEAQVAFLDQFLGHLEELNGRDRVFNAMWEQRNRQRASDASHPLPEDDLSGKSSKDLEMLKDSPAKAHVNGKSDVQRLVDSDKDTSAHEPAAAEVAMMEKALEKTDVNEKAAKVEKSEAEGKADSKASSPKISSTAETSFEAAVDGRVASKTASPAREKTSATQLRGLSQCSKCKEPFLDSQSIFVSTEDNQFLCQACAEEDRSSIPAKCVEAHQAAKAARPTKCSQCSAPFDASSPIFGSASQTGVFLCRSCVEAQSKSSTVCSVCDAAAASESDLYAHVDGSGDRLCRDCWGAQALPVCAACREPPTGAYIQVGEAIYHSECLKCSMCSNVIKDSCSHTPLGLTCGTCCKSVVAKMQKVSELLQSGDRAAASDLVEELRSMGLALSPIAPIPPCAACGKPVGASYTKVGDKIYHLDCLKCAVCSNQIEGQVVQTKMGLTCSACSERVRAQMEQLREKLERGDMSGASELVESLRAQGVEVPSVPGLGSSGSKQSDEQADLVVCAVCGKPPTASSGIIGGKMYHSECVKCFVCSSPINIEDKFAQTPSGFTCGACCDSIKDRLEQMQALLKKGDRDGAKKIAASLKAQGVDVPSLG